MTQGSVHNIISQIIFKCTIIPLCKLGHRSVIEAL